MIQFDFESCAVFNLTRFINSLVKVADKDDIIPESATLADCSKHSFTPRLCLAEHSKYLIALMFLAISKPYINI